MRQASKEEAAEVFDGRGELQMRLDFTTCFSKDPLKGLSSLVSYAQKSKESNLMNLEKRRVNFLPSM